MGCRFDRCRPNQRRGKGRRGGLPSQIFQIGSRLCIGLCQEDCTGRCGWKCLLRVIWRPVLGYRAPEQCNPLHLKAASNRLVESRVWFAGRRVFSALPSNYFLHSARCRLTATTSLLLAQNDMQIDLHHCDDGSLRVDRNGLRTGPASRTCISPCQCTQSPFHFR